ncbi:MAG: restriction endonuclease subunit S [Planktothrix rubescens PR222]
MGKYNAYEKYKDSGVEWLGEIPKHWEVKRFKFLLKDGYEGLKIGPFGSQIKSEKLSLSGNYKVYGQENVINQDFLLGYRYLEDELFEELSMYEIKANDLLITMMGTSGRCYIVPNNVQKGIMDSHLIRLRLSNIYNLQFIRYLIDESEYVSYQIRILGKGSIMHGLNSSIIKSLELIIPPKDEQEIITQFLDYKTKQLDALIAKKETLLEKLDEKRTAIISHAVTKGLDPNVPMKDSGVEWLGEIPEHWEKKRLKFVVSKIIDAEHKTALYDDNGDYLVVRTANVRTGELLLENAKFTNESVYKEWTVRAVPEQGDILFTREAPAGEACLVPEKPIVCLGQRMVLFKFDKTKYNGYFLLQSLYSGIADEFIKSLSLGSTVAHFNMSDITSIPLFIPPYNEQKQIAEYLDQQTAKIDQQKLKIQQAIDRLKEYRTALITNAVTGKIDVRQVSIS